MQSGTACKQLEQHSDVTNFTPHLLAHLWNLGADNTELQSWSFHNFGGVGAGGRVELSASLNNFGYAHRIGAENNGLWLLVCAHLLAPVRMQGVELLPLLILGRSPSLRSYWGSSGSLWSSWWSWYLRRYFWTVSQTFPSNVSTD